MTAPSQVYALANFNDAMSRHDVYVVPSEMAMWHSFYRKHGLEFKDAWDTFGVVTGGS